jgi:methyl-accepting chemotaxis protein
MAEAVRAGLDNAEKTRQAAREARLAVHQGLAQMSEMQTTVASLEGSGRAVAAVVKTIGDISFQTNLLALNASIQAAHAGSSGAGFAVVADEVRSLAGRSAEAAERIAGQAAASAGETRKVIALSADLARSLDGATAKIAESESTAARLAGDLAELLRAGQEKPRPPATRATPRAPRAPSATCPPRTPPA